jgi:hypothetical protein
MICLLCVAALPSWFPRLERSEQRHNAPQLFDDSGAACPEGRQGVIQADHLRFTRASTRDAVYVSPG